MAAVRVVSRKLLYRGRIIRLYREVLDVAGRRVVRETITHPGAVVMVPVLPNGRVVLIQQYRRSVNRVLLELPAGTLERGEQPDRCARRELQEETGWRARRLRRLARFYAAPGFISERMTLFLAQDLTWAPLRPDPDERVRPAVMTLTQALRKIRTGAICDAKTIIGMWTLAALRRGRRRRA